MNSVFLFLFSACEESNNFKSFRYHPSLWSGRRWLCCKSVNRTAFGCQAVTVWPETNNNPSKFFLLTKLRFKCRRCGTKWKRIYTFC